MLAIHDPVATAVLKVRTYAQPEQVWQVLTDAHSTPSFLHGMSAVSTWAPGDPISFQPHGLTGTVLCAHPHEHLAYSIESCPDAATYVKWTWRPGPVGTVVTLEVHETPAGPGDTEELEDAWLPVVERLVALTSAPGSESRRPPAPA